uniref:Dimer_Tnp_hAT domain-containing protein n=1 Tax=Caenorhabditis tropicalis TaxID=1561998 RepID=A0A1I7T6U2_9PELO
MINYRILFFGQINSSVSSLPRITVPVSVKVVMFTGTGDDMNQWTQTEAFLVMDSSLYQSMLSLGLFQKYLLAPDELELLESFVELTNPYPQAITRAESDSTFASEILMQFRKYMNNTMALLALFCDPRYSYLEGVLLDRSWTYIESLAESYCGKKVENEKLEKQLSDSLKIVSPVADAEETPEKRPKVADSNVFNQFLNSKIKAQEQCSIKVVRCTFRLMHRVDYFQSQIANYKATVVSGRPSDSSPLNFWKINSVRLPQLAQLARHVLSPPQSSAAVERLFSKCGDIVGASKKESTVCQNNKQHAFEFSLIGPGREIKKRQMTMTPVTRISMREARKKRICTKRVELRMKQTKRVLRRPLPELNLVMLRIRLKSPIDISFLK